MTTGTQSQIAIFLVPTGSTTAETVLTQAVNSLPSPGGTILLLSGVYLITNPVTISRSGVVITGQGRRTNIRTFDARPGLGIIFIEHSSLCTIENLIFQDTYSSYAAGITFSPNSVQNTIMNCYLEGFSSSAVVVSNECTVFNCIIKNGYNYPIRCSDEAGVASRIIGNFLQSNMTSAGIDCRNAVVTVTGNMLFQSGGIVNAANAVVSGNAVHL